MILEEAMTWPAAVVEVAGYVCVAVVTTKPDDSEPRPAQVEKQMKAAPGRGSNRKESEKS